MPRPKPRKAFTLIELMLVMGVIAILAAVMIPLVGGAINSQRKARATGEIKALAGACDAFRKLYGEFPCVRNGTYTTLATDYPAYRQDLYDQLLGRKVLQATALSSGKTNLSLVAFNDASLPNASKRVVRPLISGALIQGCNDLGEEQVAPELMTQFLDPWGNAYDYRYRVLPTATGATDATPFTTWLAPDFLLVSCGPDFVPSTVTSKPHVPLMDEYWHATGTINGFAFSTFSMGTRGTVSPAYFENGTTFNRSDNITNWSGR
jgi:prepilin-type N-terminal cleavage/methylation domain-containing protein